MNYTSLSEAEQIAEVSKLVPEILSVYGMGNCAFKNINHGFNSTFKVESNEKSFSLRINLGTSKSGNEILAEMQWLESLAGEVAAPKPVRTASGDLYTTIYFPPLATNFTAVMFEWIEGEEVGDEPTKEQLYGIGQAMAKLQLFAKNLTFTPPAFLPNINNSLLQAKDLLRPNQPKEIDDELYALLLDGLKISDDLHLRLSNETPLQPIHADLHTGNIIQGPSGLSVIDFDDAGIGLPIQDLSINALYLRKDKEREKYVAEGYSSIAELPKVSAEDFEILVMARALCLTNAILEMKAAEIVEFLPKYMQRTKKRFQHFFATGEFFLLTGE
jgi:Ser/Thr protein kinase RdoA (MazF antagonist)